jgi:chromosome segregation ATPase
MNNNAQRQLAPNPADAALPAEVPAIEPKMAQVLTLAKKNNASLTPGEINDHLARILQSYDELTALYAKNSQRFDEELGSIRQTGGEVASQLQQVSTDLQQVNTDLQHQANSLDSLSAATGTRIESVQTALQDGLLRVESDAQTQFSTVHTRIDDNVSRLDTSLQSLEKLLEFQQRILDEQSLRLDQFDAAYELLDTATRGNRKRIEAVRDETEKQHAILTTQLQGLAAFQREHYDAFNDVRKLVGSLQVQAQRLDRALQGVSADLRTHVEATRKTFKWTHGAAAGLLLLTLGGFAAVKWMPAFVPASTEQALARSEQEVAFINTQLTRLPPLETRFEAQESQIGELATGMAALQTSMGELKKTVGKLNSKVDNAAMQAAAGSLGGAPLPGSQWVRQQNPKAFTVQLAGVGSPAEMAAFIHQNASFLTPAQLSYTVTRPNGQDRYNLFYGIFDSADLARAAIDAMPAPVLANKPWVRQLGAVQNAAQ